MPGECRRVGGGAVRDDGAVVVDKHGIVLQHDDHVDRAAVALGVAVVLALPASALANVGVGVGTIPLTAGETLAPGHTYRLRPDFHLVNTGDTATVYTLRVERLSRQPGSTLAPSWVSFGATSRRLAPGRDARVPVFVHLPRDAASGSYASDVVASGALARKGATGVGVGAAAATPIRVSVGHVHRTFAAALGWPWPWWAELAAAGALVLLTLGAAARRLGLRVVVERGPSA